MTFVLGQRSLDNLVGVHPDLVIVVKHAIDLSTVDFGVPEKSTRTPAEQAEKVRQGVSKTLNSRHLIRADGFGHAVDLVPWVQGKFTWQFSDPFYEISVAMRQAANTLGVELTWGGVWDRKLGTLMADVNGLKAAVTDYNTRHPGPDFNDIGHYETNPT